MTPFGADSFPHFHVLNLDKYFNELYFQLKKIPDQAECH